MLCLSIHVINSPTLEIDVREGESDFQSHLFPSLPHLCSCSIFMLRSVASIPWYVGWLVGWSVFNINLKQKLKLLAGVIVGL